METKENRYYRKYTKIDHSSHKFYSWEFFIGSLLYYYVKSIGSPENK